MKKLTKAISIGTLSLGILAAQASFNLPFNQSQTAEASAAYTYESKVDHLNIRAAASVKSKVVGSLNKEEKVEIIRIYSNGWTSVHWKGKTAYISSKYLLPVVGYAVTKTNLNLRTGPSTSNKVLLVIPKGKKVTVHEWKNGWGLVGYNHVKGWVSEKYLLTGE
ncbi:SH3 domain-containing protein [Metabacillus sp. GX 13764]|uniref:SH3 domain-containing protein n=1 Tax=Metabacillus kandeliae TaxID=2900151 RepID=UPI001E41971A|nr:SH3 domain-containing protein [Metabacillus kandeliae]MCD7035842.1 SH3 domain-containing protein [Metabacillus kandeliae]